MAISIGLKFAFGICEVPPVLGFNVELCADDWVIYRDARGNGYYLLQEAPEVGCFAGVRCPALCSFTMVSGERWLTERPPIELTASVPKPPVKDPVAARWFGCFGRNMGKSDFLRGALAKKVSARDAVIRSGGIPERMASGVSQADLETRIIDQLKEDSYQRLMAAVLGSFHY